MKQKHTHTHTKCTQLQKMSLMRACSSGGPLREGNGDSWPGGVWHTLGVGVRVATVTTGFLKSFFPTKFLRGLSTFFAKMPGLLKRIFALFSFEKKNLLEKHSFGSSTLYLWGYWPCCLLGSGLPWARLTCAHPRIQTDLSMCLQPLGWRHQGHICWEPLELPAR